MSVLASTIFSVRNASKAAHGDIGRAPIPVAQAVNIMSETAGSGTGAMSTVAGKTVEKIDKAGAQIAKKVFNLDNAAKVSELASKAVNPLLCGAAAIRAFRDEDTASALTEEAFAMTAMLGGETLVKSFKNPLEIMIKSGTMDLESISKDLAGSKKLTNKLSAKLLNNDKVGKVFKTVASKISKMSKGQKTALLIGLELGFVAASILLFDAGKKVGQTVTGRDNSSTEQSASENENFFIQKV